MFLRLDLGQIGVCYQPRGGQRADFPAKMACTTTLAGNTILRPSCWPACDAERDSWHLPRPGCTLKPQKWDRSNEVI
jgi:hypothetical protein